MLLDEFTGDLRGCCRFSLQYLWKRAVRITEYRISLQSVNITGFPHNIHNLWFLQPSSIDIAGKTYRNPVNPLWTFAVYVKITKNIFFWNPSLWKTIFRPFFPHTRISKNTSAVYVSTFGKWNFNSKKSSIFHFDQVTDKWIAPILCVNLLHYKNYFERGWGISLKTHQAICPNYLSDPHSFRSLAQWLGGGD